jgi:hypothetical protein
VVHIVSTGLEGDNNGRMKVKTLEWLEVVAWNNEQLNFVF